MSDPILMCNRCGFEIRLYSYNENIYLYELPDGGHVSIPIRAEWCYQCKTLCAAENLSDIASIKKRVLKARRAVWFKIFLKFKSMAREDLDWAERLHYVVASRKNPPRCLSCGSFDHKELPLSGYPAGKRTTLPIQHPDCGGNFIIDDRISIWADFVCPKRYYTPDGIFMRLESPFGC